jgi:hypothetical protein
MVYCAEAGFFLLVVPWSGTWERLAGAMGPMGIGALLGAPIVRGAVSGFGLVHFVWGAHDLLGWIERRRSSDSMRT